MTQLLAVLGVALVLKLGAPSYAEREAAARALEALGPAAMPALESAAASPNPEVRRRANAILPALRRAADSRACLTPKPVRLAYRDTPLADAVADLRSRTGIPLALDPDGVADPRRPVTCATGDVPPWEAVDALCRAAGLREVFHAGLPDAPPEPPQSRRTYTLPCPPMPEDVPVTLADGHPNPLPGSRGTAVRVLVLPPEFPGNRARLRENEVTLNLDVAPMPGFHWGWVEEVRVGRVTDSAGRAGHTVAPQPPPDRLVYAIQKRALFGEPSVTPPAPPSPRIHPLTLKLPTPGARSLRVLEGAVVGRVYTRDQPLAEVDHLPDAAGRTVTGADGMRVRVVEVRQGDATRPAAVRLEVEIPGVVRVVHVEANGIALPMELQPGAITKVWGTASDGSAVAAAGATTTSIADVPVGLLHTVEVTFPPGQQLPARLSLLGVRRLTVEVPFVLENVPLP